MMSLNILIWLFSEAWLHVKATINGPWFEGKPVTTQTRKGRMNKWSKIFWNLKERMRPEQEKGAGEGTWFIKVYEE